MFAHVMKWNEGRRQQEAIEGVHEMYGPGNFIIPLGSCDMDNAKRPKNGG
jgi:hypothetical protein